MRKLRIVLCLLLVAAMLWGCSADQGGSLADRLEQIRQTAVPREEPSPEATAPTEPEPLRFSQMEYIHPDLQEMEALFDQACALAQGEDPEAVWEAAHDFYDAYDWFYTHYYLADIHYSQDLTDPYWEEEYNYCVTSYPAVDAWLEELHYALADSPCREALEGEDFFGPGAFDGYDGENNWDAEFTAMLEQEAQLQNEYYALTGAATDHAPGTRAYYDAYAQDMAQVLVDLVKLRLEMARYWGYDSYAEFAWDLYYYRDYTPREMETYLDQVGTCLVPLYRQMAQTNVWNGAYRHCTEENTYAFVRSGAENMGGSLWEAFQLMEQRELYDLTYSENKYTTSFEVYLTGYQVPFLFVCPDQVAYDKLTFAHEFGHFANDYATAGSAAGIDVLEIFSQSMEYLCLCYAQDGEELARVKLADSLSTYVEQSAYGAFEMALYQLPEDQLTVQGICRLYEQTALEYGYDSVGYDRREFVDISHFYTNPMYVPSYVVSNDAAMQIYELELESPGKGLKRVTDTLATTESYFLAFLEDADLESPFASGRLEAVAEVFRQKLLN